MFEATSDRLVETITEVTYRRYRRRDLTVGFLERSDLRQFLTKAWVAERQQSDRLAFDLGRGMSDERVSQLILNLMTRLDKRGMVQNQTMEFPLRQHHIADATGLTPVHVCKLLTEFRQVGLIEISNRSLTILDLPALRRIAGVA